MFIGLFGEAFGIGPGFSELGGMGLVRWIELALVRHFFPIQVSLGFKVRLLLPEKIPFQNCQLMLILAAQLVKIFHGSSASCEGHESNCRHHPLYLARGRTGGIFGRLPPATCRWILGQWKGGQRDHPKSLEMVSWVVDASLVSIIISYL